MSNGGVVPPTDSHDPQRTARELAGKLASRARHVCLLIGAGAGASAGLPLLAQLQDLVLQELDGDDKTALQTLLVGRNLEQVLSRLRRIRGLLEPGENLGGITAERAEELDRLICSKITVLVDATGKDVSAFVSLASWAARMESQTSVELFTVNYDLLIEAGLEHLGVPYFDGFVGSVSARFLPELVEPAAAQDARRLPTGFVRLWKLHGSVNWYRVKLGAQQEVVRLGSQADPPASVAIYPSDEKYEESRRVPFVVLMDRFRRALMEPETIALVSGFSFNDDHLNEMLFDAARRHARSEVLALCYSDIPPILAEQAKTTRNLVVLSPVEAIIDGRAAPWAAADPIPGVFEDEKFLLGDFKRMAAFLSRQVGQTDDNA